MLAVTITAAALGLWLIYLLGYRHGTANERMRRRARSHYVDTLTLTRKSGAR